MIFIMFINFLFVVPVIIPSQPIQVSSGFKSFILLLLFIFSIIFVIESIINFIGSFKK